MTALFTTARSDDLDDTLERPAHQALTEFCERHLPVLGDTVGDLEFPTHHAGWALTTRYAQHVISLLQEVTAPALTCASAWSSAPVR
jgi:hypothetical protein